MRQDIFNEIVKSISALEQESEIRDPFIFFEPIFKFFKTTLDSKSNFNFILYNYKQIKYKSSWNKNEKSFTMKLLQKFQDNVKFDNYFLNFNNNFKYAFFINPSSEELNINDGEYKFLQIIEFKVA